jgi:hypothetical protein
MRHAWSVPLIAAALIGGMVSCGGGGSASSTTPTAPTTPTTPTTPALPTVGYTVPTEVSPVSTSTSSQAGARTLNASGFGRALAALTAPAYADAGTDYSDAQTVRYVSQQSIDQFSIIETILNATAQTHYADTENLGAGPYKSIVSWQENKQGGNSKQIQTWIVDSSMVLVNDVPVNRINAWIEDSGRVLKAQFNIYASANQAADGSYLDYGVWTLNVKFSDAGDQYFTAQASLGANGESVVAINQYQLDNGNGSPRVVQAVLHKSPSTGYGKVSYPQDQNNGTSVQTTASYVYNAGQLLVHKTVPAPATLTYHDRTTSVPITLRYGLYDAVTGEDVVRSHSFGFPVSFSLDGVPQYGFYGANQGMDQLWTNGGQTIPDGTTVTRQDQGADGASYQTVSYLGTLSKRTYVAGTINDLLNIPVQTCINFQHQLTWSAGQSAWTESGSPFTQWDSLVAQPQKMVWIGGWDSVHNMQLNLVYDPNGPGGAGFYPATQGGNGSMTMMPGAAMFVPTDGTMLWVNIGGSIYIEYTGAATGWIQKSVVSFNQNTWTPTFDPAGDSAFSLGLNRQYFINNQGGNFIVTQTSASPATYDVRMEVLNPANPTNLADVVGGAASFKPVPFNSGASTYRFEADPGQANFLKLVYLTVGSQDAQGSPVPQVGDVVAKGLYGLEAYDAQGADLNLEYDWNYPGNGGNYGTQTFLTTGSGASLAYTLLDNPIQLAPLNLTVNGASRTLSLRYDGWMQGLPDINGALAMNDYVINDDITSKVINIPAGTLVTDQQDSSKAYVIKPLEIGLYLPVAATPDTSLDITQADAMNLGDPAVIPTFVDAGLGDEPTITVPKYVDGVKQ